MCGLVVLGPVFYHGDALGNAHGFDRVSFANIGRSAERSADTAFWALWLMCVVAYAQQLFALWLLHHADRRVCAAAAQAAAEGTARKYAVVVTDVPDDGAGAAGRVATARLMIATALGNDDALLYARAIHVTHPPRTLADIRLGGMSARLKKYEAALDALAHAHAAEVKTDEDGKPQPMAGVCGRGLLTVVQQRTVELTTADASVRALLATRDAKRQSLNPEAAPADAHAVLAVVNTLRAATMLAAAPLTADSAESWNVAPAPEPRDVDWDKLETLPSAASRRARASVAAALFVGLTVFWTIPVSFVSALTQLEMLEASVGRAGRKKDASDRVPDIDSESPLRVVSAVERGGKDARDHRVRDIDSKSPLRVVIEREVVALDCSRAERRGSLGVAGAHAVARTDPRRAWRGRARARAGPRSRRRNHSHAPQSSPYGATSSPVPIRLVTHSESPRFAPTDAAPRPYGEPTRSTMFVARSDPTRRPFGELTPRPYGCDSSPIRRAHSSPIPIRLVAHSESPRLASSPLAQRRHHTAPRALALAREGLLPVIALVLLMELFRGCVLPGLARAAGAWTRSAQEAAVQRDFTIFLLCHLFLVVTLSGSLFEVAGPGRAGGEGVVMSDSRALRGGARGGGGGVMV